jgi:hypothetical protein
LNIIIARLIIFKRRNSGIDNGLQDCIFVTADDKDLQEVIDKNLIPEPSELFLAPVHLQLFAYRQN